MTKIRVDPEILNQCANRISDAQSRVDRSSQAVMNAGNDAPDYDGQFGPRVRAICREAGSRGRTLADRERQLAGSLQFKAQAFATADMASLQGWTQTGKAIEGWQEGSAWLSGWNRNQFLRVYQLETLLKLGGLFRPGGGPAFLATYLAQLGLGMRVVGTFLGIRLPWIPYKSTQPSATTTPRPYPTPGPKPVPMPVSRNQPQNTTTETSNQQDLTGGNTSVDTGKSAFQFKVSPVPMDKVTSTNWYGNTEFAYNHRSEYYSQLQGFHSGLDFMCPIGTPIFNPINCRGKIIAIDGKSSEQDTKNSYSFGAGPHNILVDYGDFLVLYGHSSGVVNHKIGDFVEPGQQLGTSGTDGYTAHLHLEVIKKDASWENLPSEKKLTVRPGNVRTNPVPYLSDEVKSSFKEKIWDKFHPTDDGKWQSPEVQPDITPSAKPNYFVK